jgi:hypothetical protein
VKAIIITPAGLMAATTRTNYIAESDQRTGFLAETKVPLPSLGSTFCILRAHCDILKGNEGAFAPEGLTFFCTQVCAADQYGGKLLSMALFLSMTRIIVVENTTYQTRVLTDDSHGPQSGTLPTLWQSKLQADPRTSFAVPQYLAFGHMGPRRKSISGFSPTH